MVAVYECDACRKGNHEECEIGRNGTPGMIGGGFICSCGCRGRSVEQRRLDTEAYIRRQLELAAEMENREECRNKRAESSEMAKLYIARDEVGSQDVMLYSCKPKAIETEGGIYWDSGGLGEEMLVVTDQHPNIIRPGDCYELGDIDLGDKIR